MIVVLIVLFGIFADFFTNRIMFKQKQLEVVHAYGALTRASHHVLDNLLNQMHLFRIEVLKSKDFDRKVIELCDNAIQEAAGLRNIYMQVGELSEGKRSASLDPETKSNRASHSDHGEAN
jgi:hypothetical protein